MDYLELKKNPYLISGKEGSEFLLVTVFVDT